MSFWSKLFKKKSDDEARVGGMEDFMLLIRVYYQAVIAAQLGINNLGALPDLRVFKQTYHVPTLWDWERRRAARNSFRTSMASARHSSTRWMPV